MEILKLELNDYIWKFILWEKWEVWGVLFLSKRLYTFFNRSVVLSFHKKYIFFISDWYMAGLPFLHHTFLVLSKLPFIILCIELQPLRLYLDLV